MCKNSEKMIKKQRNAFVKLVKNQLYIAETNPFIISNNEVSLTLPQFQGMTKDSIKPILKAAIGYIPEILLFQETTISYNKKDQIPVVLLLIKMKK